MLRNINKYIYIYTDIQNSICSLGNPVMPVDVSVEAPSQDCGDLIETMQRIEQRLQALKGHLQGN